MEFSQKQVNIAVVGITLISVTIAAMAYFDNKKHEVIKDDLLSLDRQIKTLELALKNHEATKKGIV